MQNDANQYTSSRFFIAGSTTMTIKARKDSLISHGRLAFCTATKILLALISRTSGSTDTRSRKPDDEEKMFWKVTLPSALIFFSANDICTINITFFNLICICNRVRSVSF